MNRSIVITDMNDIQFLHDKLKNAAIFTKKKLKSLIDEETTYELLYKLKFEQCGTDPLEQTPMNIIEQLNQQHTYHVSLKAVEYLLKFFPEYGPFTMNLGTAGGYDIESSNQMLVSEVFSAVDPTNNQKLKKDMIRMADAVAEKKFVFYHSPLRYKSEDRMSRQYENVEIVYIETLD